MKKLKLNLFRKYFLTQFVFLLCFFNSQSPAWAADGDLDTSFDTDGIAITEIGKNAAEAHSLVMQSDGKIVAAGYMQQVVSPFPNIFAVVRYNTDGSLDNTFSGDGIQTTAIGLFNSEAWDVVVQSDGKIVVVGITMTGASSTTFAVVRYNTDGSLDNTFSGDGIETTDVASQDEEAYSVVLQSDGKIVVAGYSNNGSDNDFAVVRYNTDGSLDTTFDTDGIQTTDIGDSKAESVVLQSDGKIIVAGFSSSTGSGDFAVVRYNTDGSLDTTFDTDGIQTTDFAGRDKANSVVLQSDGKIVVAGESHAGTKIAVARYNTDGSLDITFDTDGKQSTAIANEANGQEVILQSDGKIVVAGFIMTVIGVENNYDFAVARYNTDGSLDTTFSGDGIQTTRIDQIPPGLTEPFSPFDQAYSVVLQSDGKIVVAGTSHENELNFAVVRYLNTVSSSTALIWVGAQSISCPAPNPWVEEQLGFATNTKPVLVSAENTIGKTITQGSYDALKTSGVLYDTVSTKVSTATETLPIYGCKDKLLSGKVNQPIQFIAGGYTLQSDAHGYINTADLKWHDTNGVTLYTNTAAFMHTVKFTKTGKYVVVLTEQPDTSRGLIPTYGVRSIRFVININ